ncbi:Vacuolar glucose transporter 1 [Cymbomonas tetramitiformis]|uniref:Vacuolar glucose transporter 1 n=1 Tax=Cymbomonas tetramitiformis TaxID=36881 RepID=A0AAE0LEU3_9CHLO|nr:Vacuolar glucose transporter 1 [Cymbomonas tetramitiformis]|eukprot:gene11825-13960_t
MGAPAEKGPYSDLNTRVFSGFLFPALGGLLFGYDIGATSFAFSDDQAAKDLSITDDALKGTMTAMSLYGALAISVFLYFFGDAIGRKKEMLAASVLYIAGSVLSFATPISDKNTGVAWLASSRFIYGLGIGCAMHSVPVYISEMAPSSVRGMLVSLKEAVIVVGMLLGYSAGALFNHAHGWKIAYLGGALFAFVFGIGCTFLPDSPRWLILRSLSQPDRYSTKAQEALQWFRTSFDENQVESELAEVRDTLAGQEVGTFAELLKAKRQMIVGNGLLLFQQITCQPSVLYYSVTIFKSAGFGSSSSTIASVGVAAVKLVATMVAGLRVDQYGRRPLLLVGTTGIMLSLFGMGLAFQLGYEDGTGDSDGSLTKVWGMVCVGCVLVLVTSYQIGFGPISWLMISEVFPLRIRGMALSVGSMVNFGGNIIVANTFPVVLSALGSGPSFFMFSVIAAVAIVFIHFVIPETKGKTLEEIEEMMSSDEQRSSKDLTHNLLGKATLV